MIKYILAIFLFLNLLVISSSSSKIENTKNKKGFAVVELFTSEGCSSCPAADEAVIEISKEYKTNVFIMGFHVDYWNYLGWKDAFSNPNYSERQKQYASVFSLNSIYTPQIVVNGSSQFVGSDKEKLKNTIDRELNANFHSNIMLTTKEIAHNKIAVEIKSGNVQNSFIQLALIQLQAESKVLKGENEGRHLRHINLVRDFKTMENMGTEILTVPEGLAKKDFKIIVFVQNKTNLQIEDAIEVAIE